MHSGSDAGNKFLEGVHVLLQLPEHQVGSVTQQIAQIGAGLHGLAADALPTFIAIAEHKFAWLDQGDAAVFCAQDLVSFATVRGGVTRLGFFLVLGVFLASDSQGRPLDDRLRDAVDEAEMLLGIVIEAAMDDDGPAVALVTSHNNVSNAVHRALLRLD